MDKEGIVSANVEERSVRRRDAATTREVGEADYGFLRSMPWSASSTAQTAAVSLSFKPMAAPA